MAETVERIIAGGEAEDPSTWTVGDDNRTGLVLRHRGTPLTVECGSPEAAMERSAAVKVAIRLAIKHAQP